MRVILANHDDFRDEKTVVENFFLSKCHKVHFIPKFHSEMNPIERVRGQAKRYTRAHTNFTIPGLRNIIEPGLYSVSVDLIRKCKARESERAYREGHQAGMEVEMALKQYKSHRRIFYESV